jgi:PKD repeat protein
VQALALTVPGATDTGSFVISHAYANAGSFTVTVVVTDNDGMSGTATVGITVASPVGRFVALSKDMTWLRANSTAVTGDVGATDRRHAGHDSDVDAADDGDRDDVTMRVGVGATVQQAGSRVVGDTVLLLNNASIDNVIDNFLIANKKATVLGTTTNTMPVPFANFPAFDMYVPPASAAADVTVAKNKSQPLAPGTYGTVHVGANATLTLATGVYQMVALDLDQGASVVVSGTGVTELRIETELHTTGKAQINAGRTVTASRLVIYVAGVDAACQASEPDDDGDNPGPVAVHIGAQSNVQANIYALNGTVWLKSKTQATGAFLGVHVRIGMNATIALDSAFK